MCRNPHISRPSRSGVCDYVVFPEAFLIRDRSREEVSHSSQKLPLCCQIVPQAAPISVAIAADLDAARLRTDQCASSVQPSDHQGCIRHHQVQPGSTGEQELANSQQLRNEFDYDKDGRVPLGHKDVRALRILDSCDDDKSERSAASNTRKRHEIVQRRRTVLISSIPMRSIRQPTVDAQGMRPRCTAPYSPETSSKQVWRNGQEETSVCSVLALSCHNLAGGFPLSHHPSHV